MQEVKQSEAFIKELKELLFKYKAEIYVTEINQKAYLGGDHIIMALLDDECDNEINLSSSIRYE